jgi:hypothetical protein
MRISIQLNDLFVHLCVHSNVENNNFCEIKIDHKDRYLTCKFHSGGHSVLAIGMEHSGTGPYRYTIPDFIIIIIYE